jgi:hypothetical protein
MSDIHHMSDHEIIARALSMWKNYMETGNVNLSNADALNCGNKDLIKPLNDEQVQFGQRLKKLSLRSLEIDSQNKMNRINKQNSEKFSNVERNIKN